MVRLADLSATVPEALRMGIDLRWYWEYRGRSTQGAALLHAALGAEPDRQPPDLRAMALAAAGRLHANCGEVALARACLDEGLRLGRGLDDPALLAELLVRESQARYRQGDYDGARSAAEEAVALGRRSGDGRVLADALERSGANRWAFPDQQDLARQELEEALAYYQARGDGERTAACHNNLGLTETMAGNLTAARAHYAAAVAHWESAGDHAATREDLALVNQNLVFVALLQEDLPAARRFLHGSLDQGPVSEGQVAYQVLSGALFASADGEPERGATLHGAADSLLAEVGELWEPLEARLGAHDRHRLREALGGPRFEERYEEGRRLSKVEAVVLARPPVETAAGSSDGAGEASGGLVSTVPEPSGASERRSGT